MPPDKKIFIIETEQTVTRQYRIEVGKDENPWDVWRAPLASRLFGEHHHGEEKAVSVERVRGREEGDG